MSQTRVSLDNKSSLNYLDSGTGARLGCCVLRTRYFFINAVGRLNLSLGPGMAIYALVSCVTPSSSVMNAQGRCINTRCGLDLVFARLR